MSNNKISFKNMNNSDKVKLINNSLVLDGISLKELSKKIDIQKKDIIKFMNEEGFFFDIVFHDRSGDRGAVNDNGK